MDRKFSVKIVLKNLLDSLEIFEESVVIVKSDNVDNIKEKIDLYVDTLNENSENKIFELVSILDYFEIKEEIHIEDTFVDIYSRFLNNEELKLYEL